MARYEVIEVKTYLIYDNKRKLIVDSGNNHKKW